MITHKHLLGGFLDLLDLGVGKALDLEQLPVGCGDETLQINQYTSRRTKVTSTHGNGKDAIVLELGNVRSTDS